MRACVRLSRKLGGWIWQGTDGGYDSSLEVFVDGFYTDGACLGVGFANSSLLYVWLVLL